MVAASPRSHEYDLVVLGGGCAGLSLLVRLIRSGWTKGRRILLVEKNVKESNDRTWCFWEKKPGFFEDIVYCRWNQLAFFSEGFSRTTGIVPYTYKLIRGVDFYRYCHHIIAQNPEVEMVRGTVEHLIVEGDVLQFHLENSPIQLRCPLVFNSIYDEKEDRGKLRLLQHFRGWVVRTSKPVFSPGVATFMDFRVPQDAGTTFVYTLPFGETEALVEYTVFSKAVLPESGYEAGLKNYLEKIVQAGEYEILGKESGVIPMTDHVFRFYRNGMFHLGTAGGQTKASSGYTFQFIQRQCEAVVKCIAEGGDIRSIQNTPSRYRFYDNTLLYILYHDRLPGEKVFTTLFRKNRMEKILSFLDNQSSLGEELKIIGSLPFGPFFRAALRW